MKKYNYLISKFKRLQELKIDYEQEKNIKIKKAKYDYLMNEIKNYTNEL